MQTRGGKRRASDGFDAPHGPSTLGKRSPNARPTDDKENTKNQPRGNNCRNGDEACRTQEGKRNWLAERAEREQLGISAMEGKTVTEEMINFAIKDSSARVEGFLGDADAEVVKRGLLLSGFKLSGTGKSPRRLVCTKDNLDPQFRDLLLTNAAQRSGQPVDSLLVNLYPLNSEDDPHDYGMRAHCDQIPGCVRLALRLLIVPHGTWVEKKLESKTILTIAGHDYCRKIVVSRTDSGLALGDVEHGSRAHPGIGCVLKHEVPAHDEGTLVVSVIHTWDVPFSQQATFLQNLRDQCAAVGDKFPVMQVTSAEVETLSYSNPAFARCCLADLNAQAGENGRAKMTRARTAVATGSASS
eukprot:CAMPEP_0118920638 /NCGR_PEP_ID=MMETSP1169-20130426/66_1 /TAXON_ID=36882 /ORGANISM="Pyramimonas obovata, Strain CCMP722" /LENGTH=355 /DNA_ID=CAMNT_0006861199 /DNA_START=147 /DNA_END=1211 /DNA_ORIENTATION=-